MVVEWTSVEMPADDVTINVNTSPPDTRVLPMSYPSKLPDRLFCLKIIYWSPAGDPPREDVQAGELHPGFKGEVAEVQGSRVGNLHVAVGAIKGKSGADHANRRSRSVADQRPIIRSEKIGRISIPRPPA